MSRFWTKSDDELLKKLYPTSDNLDLAAIFNRTPRAVLIRANALGVFKAPDYVKPGWFKRGEPTWNSGMKGWMPAGIERTQFKPGQMPHNHNPLGHERITDDGYLQRKMTDTGCTRRDYRFVHHLVWEAAHGPVPKGFLVVFRDGNKMNFDPTNLELITRSENMKRNSRHNLPKEISDLMQLRGALNRRIRNLEKKSNG